MDGQHLLAYFFGTFAVGVSCLGALLVLARGPDTDLARSFLLFYTALTILVFGRLLLAFVSIAPAPAASTQFSLVYLESLIGRYGVMFALPFFAHRVFRVGGRDAWLGALVLAAAGGQHLTEFALGGTFWDDAGDVAEDALFASIILYTGGTGLKRWRQHDVYRPLAVRFLVLLGIGLPGVAHDLFLSDGTAWRFYPLWYCVLSVVLTATLVARRFSAGRSIPEAWQLSPRERQVVRLVARGLTNHQIARELSISTNTVKTHLQTIFDKSGFRTRTGLIAALAGSRQNHPTG